MKFLLTSVSALACVTGAAHAAGLDRSGQSLSPIFAADNTAQLSLGIVMPDVTGEDVDGGPGEYDAAEDYFIPTLSYTNRVTPQFNYSVIFDTPYGVDIDYGGNPLTDNLGGTAADLDSQAITFVGRYAIGERFSIFGGIKAEEVEAEVDLNGRAYNAAISSSAVADNAPVPITASTVAAIGGVAGPAAQGAAATAVDTAFGPGTAAAIGAAFANQAQAFAANGGYTFDMEKDTKPGYVIGAAYEIPDIALRFAATYSFEIEHDADTTETLFGITRDSSVDYVTPASLNLEFQTGIAPGTLLLASYRWTEFSEVDVTPELLGRDLVNLDDGHRYSLGLGRQFSPELAGSLSMIYEPEGDDLVSPLGPTNGLFGVTVGGAYTDGPIKVSGGVNYSRLGDATAEVGGNGVVDFEDNHSLAIGLRAEIAF